MLETLFWDLRSHFRGLLARPGFVSAVVLTLALGLGVNTAIFTTLHHVLLRPLPVPSPEKLVNVEFPGYKPGAVSTNFAGYQDSVTNYPMFRDLEQAQGSLIKLAAHRTVEMNLAYRQETVEVDGVLVSGSYFPALELTPALGRLISPADDVPSEQARSVVLGHGFWREQFGADPSVVGQTVRVNGLTVGVIGIAPPGFQGTTAGVRADLYVPITVDWPNRDSGLPELQDRTLNWTYVFGRLLNDTSRARALQTLQARYRAVRADIEAPLHDLNAEQRERFLTAGLQLAPGEQGQSWVQEEAAIPLVILMCVASLVLLIACLNIANLQMARGTARIPDIAIRSAIGATTGDLRRHLLGEALSLALMGSVVALPVAAWVITVISGLLSTYALNVVPPGLSLVAVGYTFSVAILTILVFALLPAWKLARTSPMQVLRLSSGQAGEGRGTHRFRSGLLVVQIAFSLALLVLAGLFARSLDEISQIDLGFDSERLLSFSVAPELNGYSPTRSVDLFDRIERELEALPGVEEAGIASLQIAANNSRGTQLTVEGYESAPNERMAAGMIHISPNFLDALGTPLRSGRAFSRFDLEDSGDVAIVNRAFIERFDLPDDPAGMRISRSPEDPAPDIQIVGVAADSVYSNVKQTVPPVVYFPIRQHSSLGRASVYVRTEGNPEALIGAVRSTIAQIDPDLPISGLSTMDERVQENVAVDRLVGVLSAGLAALATVLAAVGLYGLVAYIVAQRRRELGLRMALGAKPTKIQWLVLRHIGSLSLIGTLLGLFLAFGMGRATQSLLFGLKGHDPLTFLLAITVLLAVVALAAWAPVLRASRSSPMVTLRYD